MPGANENHRNISHHGLKEAQGFVRPSTPCGPQMGPGLTSMTPFNAAPHGSTDKLAPREGRHERNLTTGRSHDELKTGANNFPSGRR